MMREFRVAVWLVVAGAGAAGAYPLDGYEATGIARLEAFDLARAPLLARGTLKPGSLLTLEEVDLRLRERPDFSVPDSDPNLSSQIRALLGGDAAGYGIAILDITDPTAPRYAEHNGSMVQNPGSVGKVAVALAFFQGLADAHPDLETRHKILTETQLAANGFIRTDHHVVPFWKPGDSTVKRRPIEETDSANLYTWLDWMCSASSNAAASMLMSQVMLLKHFGSEYPVSDEVAAGFFANTPKEELTKIYMDALISPLGRNGLDSKQLRQGSFFTREGKARVPGTNSVANARELMRYLVLMEQGRLVDVWSSREIKRLLYLTDIRIRYAASPALDDAAVYFKSGSLYSCKEEPGFECGKYMGNSVNYMNSLAVVETVENGRPLRYMVVLLSNVLRKNSADKHQALAADFQDIIGGFHRAPAATEPTEGEATTSGK